MKSSVRLLFLVFAPFVFQPQGEVGCRPPDVFPSPPPIGWATGFIATPRTCGRRPIQRLRPALPRLIDECSTLPSCPIVARQLLGRRRISPDGSVICAHLPSRALSTAATPALRQS